VTVVSDGARPLVLCGIMMDITERKKEGNLSKAGRGRSLR
jgi:hypothetical protein